MRTLVTGGCGFIGSNLIRELLSLEDIVSVVNLDALTYSGNPKNLIDINDIRYSFIHGSINDKDLLSEILKDSKIEVVLHLAAESHVDRSIHSCSPFIKTNIDGTRVVLESILERRNSGQKVSLVHVSTDEVYGSLSPEEPEFTEDSQIRPRNPYAVTKASSDLLVQAFVNTYELEAVITRCSNNYGPFQFPEKLIPLITINSLEDRKLPVYGDGKQIRDWIHVKDHCRGIIDAAKGLKSGKVDSGDVINFGASNEKTNIEIVNTILSILDKPINLIQYVKDRPGHDRRYAMGYEKAKSLLGWEPEIDWEGGIKETVRWYVDNSVWVSEIKSGEYLNWIEKHY